MTTSHCASATRGMSAVMSSFASAGVMFIFQFPAIMGLRAMIFLLYI